MQQECSNAATALELLTGHACSGTLRRANKCRRLASAVKPEGEGNKSRCVAPYMEEACVQKLFEVANDSQVDQLAHI